MSDGPLAGGIPGGPGALVGVRVLDLSTMIAGSVSAAWLGDFGADVVKVEHPRGGDPLRALQQGANSRWWEVVNRNKRSITLDLSSEPGAGLVRRLAAGFDVVVENFRPGTLERWNLGYATLSRGNRKLVLTRLSGFGQDGPESRRPAYGTLLEAFSGFSLTLGEPGAPPVLPPYGLGDHVAAVFGAYGTALALLEAQRSGIGQVVDVSIYEPLLALLGPLSTQAWESGEAPPRTGNRTMNAAPRNSYRTADGWVVISAATPRLFAAVMVAIGRPEAVDDPRFATNAARLEHVEQLDELIEAWTSQRTRDDVVATLQDAGAPVGPVLDLNEVVGDVHVLARRSFVQVQSQSGGLVLEPAPVPRLARTPGAIQRSAPLLGQHTDEVLKAEVSLSDDELARYRAIGAV